MSTTVRTAIACAALAAWPLFAGAQSAPETVIAAGAPAPSAGCATPARTGLQQRLIDKEPQGVDALRQYLFITRSVHNTSMDEAVAFLDQDRRVRKQCVAASGTSPQS